MALFKRKNENAPGDKTPHFPRLVVRQVIVYEDWYGIDLIFTHLEKDHKNILKAKFEHLPEWFSVEATSRADGDEKMKMLANNWQNAIEIGLLPQDLSKRHVGQQRRFFGLADIDLTSEIEVYEADLVFTLGREFAEKLAGDWYPSTELEFSHLFNFIVYAPIKVGFYGPFKFVLKALTDKFPNHVGNMSELYAARIAAAIAYGYGKIEGSAARGKQAPQEFNGWQLDSLAQIPELSGFRHPTLKTSQYLMRKGGRFLDYLESNHPGLITTYFKIQVLRGADENHHEESLNEDMYLTLQQLTNRILYREAGLSERDRESRKVHLSSKNERHNLRLEREFFSSLGEDEVKAYRNWLEIVIGRNAAVAHFAYHLWRQLPEASLNVNPVMIKTLLNSASEEVQEFIWEAIEKNPALLQVVPTQTIVKVLDEANDHRLAVVLDQVRNFPWVYRPVMNAWIELHLSSKLTERDIKIATSFLLHGWEVIENYAWNDRKPLRNSIFLEVAELTKLQPFEQWKKVLSFYEWNDNQFLALFGIKPNEIYNKGILDVIDIRETEMLAHFSKILVKQLRYQQLDASVNMLMEFFNCTKPGATEIIWRIIGSNLVSAELFTALMGKISVNDPGGAAYLRGVSSALEMGDRKALLQMLTLLSNSAPDMFWRRNKTELQGIFFSWKKFPSFYWENSEKIPSKVFQFFSSFDGLDLMVLEIITPASVARMNNQQVDMFLQIVRKNPNAISKDSLLRAMLVAPSAAINEFAANFVKQENLYGQYWLLMLESNLPISTNAAFLYLETQIEAKNFVEKLLMILDSNNPAARKMGIQLLRRIKSQELLKNVVNALVENRNIDTWREVVAHLELIDDSTKYHEFTNQVFLSRRKGREVKEKLKNGIEELLTEVSHAVEEDTLIRMAHSSVAKDREWALQQIAKGAIQSDEISIEEVWR